MYAFYKLRSGATLPGGGAGSLNDWGPFYSDKEKDNWFSELYKIIRYLFDHHLPAEQMIQYNSIKYNNNIRIIRCLHCNKSYQHPNSFESHIALDFYKSNFISFAHKNALLDLIKPELSIHSPQANAYRDWLTKQYELQNIKIYDFVSHQYVCPHCAIKDNNTEHDLYQINEISSGQKEFHLQKQNAQWQDFFPK